VRALFCRIAEKKATRERQQNNAAEYQKMLTKLKKERQDAKQAMHEKRRTSSRKSESEA